MRLVLVGILLVSALPVQAEVRKLTNGAGPERWVGDLTPIAASDWTYECAAHLLERAGFGGTPQEIDQLFKLGPRAAVDYLVDYEKVANPLPEFQESGIFNAGMMADVNIHYPDFTDALRTGMRKGEIYGVKANPDGVRKMQPIVDMLYYRGFAEGAEWRRAAQWWAERMLVTKRPLEEKLTLFWHGHFATEDAKVSDYRLMLQQQTLLRSHANGNFRDLLQGIAKNPAMLIYLDARRNVKGTPNENFAREIMELFSLGAGNYTEKDIKEAARAFTGWDNKGLDFVIHRDLHDDDVKHLLGKDGNFTGEQAIDILLEQKACADFISRKLYRFFVREEVSPALNAKLGTELRGDRYELKPWLKTVLLSRDFYSAPSFATEIKSPVEYVISTYRKLGLTEIPGTPYFETVMANLGQVLGNPPNVKGWDGGRNWVNPSTLLVRGNVVRHALFPAEAAAEYPRHEIPPGYRNAKENVAKRDKELANQASAPAPNPSVKDEEMKGDASMSMAPLSKKIGRAPEYDLGFGVYNGFVRTFATVKPTPASEAKIDLKGLSQSAGVKSSADVIDYFVARFMSLPIADADRKRLIAYASTQLGSTVNYADGDVERKLRDVLYVVLSMPEYQLG